MTAKDYLTIGARSALGFGAMRLPDKNETELMIDTYLDSGFNYFDTAWIYEGSEEMLRETLVKRHSREKFLVADKMPPWEVKNWRDCDELFEKQRVRTGLEFFDFYLVHSVDDEKERGIDDMRLFEWAMEKKAKGLVRHVGFSFHGTAACLSRALRAHPEAEFIQLQLNYSDVLRGPAGEWRELAEKHGVPIVVMGPVKGGSLSKLPAPAEKILLDAAPGRSISSWAVRYAATLRGVTCVLSGMSSMEQLRDNLKTFADLKPFSDEEISILKAALTEMGKVASIPCTACKYCHASCPQNIDIAACFTLYNELKRGGADWNIKMSYNTLPESSRAGNCTACGVCNAFCPQKIDIPTGLGTVGEAFGGEA